jgi:hypothetical protein
VALDNFAALSVDGASSRVVSRAGKQGSVLPDGSIPTHRSGTPGIWKTRRVSGELSKFWAVAA